MKTRDKASLAIFLAVITLLAMVAGTVFAVGQAKCWWGHDYDKDGICTKCGYVKPADEEEIEKNNEQLAFAMNDQGMLKLSKIRRVANTNDIASSETGSQVITATVSGDATDKSVSWSIAWKNASSAWASGKNIAEYITLTPNDEDNSVQVDCLRAFGEQAIITCKANGAEDLTATATVDFVKRIVGVKVDCDKINLADSSSTSAAKSTFTASVTYGIGTIENKDSVTVTIDKIDFELSSAVQTGIAGDVANLKAMSASSASYVYHVTTSKTPTVQGDSVSVVVGFNDFLALTGSQGEIYVKAARGRVYKNVSTDGWYIKSTAHVTVRVNGVTNTCDVALNVPISNTYLSDYTIPDSLTLDIDKIEF